MPQLTTLRHRLSGLRRRRLWMRWGMAWAALGVAGLWSLLAIFALDVALELSVVQRVAVMALCAAVVAWGVRRFVTPWLGIQETETDTALFVEREHRIDSDLVAALQFDRQRPETYGSRDLQTAVVERVQELGARLDVSRGTDRRPLTRRVRLLGATAVASLAICLLFPRHLSIFFSRLALSQRHYPSATIIERILVNSAVVWEWNDLSARPRDARSAQGRSVTFLVECRGDLPEKGEVDCRSLPRGTGRHLVLRRLSPEELSNLRIAIATGAEVIPRGTSSGGVGQPVFYLAELPRMVEEFAYTLRMGDAWTDAARVAMIEPPAIQATVQVTPPEYASADNNSPPSPSHLAVLEGSRVSLNVRCLNQKRLKSATIKISAGDVANSYPLEQSASGGTSWQLPAVTPLANVTQELRYELQVLDEDGLELESPLHGFVQLKVDRPPSAVASIVHRVVLPGAKPVIEFRLTDDYGIGSALLQGHVQRFSAASNPTTDSLGAESAANPTSTPMADSSETPDEKSDWRIPLDPSPVVGQNLPYRGKFALDLSLMKLAKGDQLKLQISVTDHRGAGEGKLAWSEPLLLEISDEAGVLAAITETDERSEKRLSDVIKQQLGVGGNK